jgi:mono/diheme cytochrome c family protein
VSTHLTPLDPYADVPPAPAVPIASAVTAVDMAISPHDARVAIVAAGNNWAPADQQLLMLPPIEDPAEPGVPPAPCQNSTPVAIHGEAIAVAFDGLNRWVVQSREPALLEVEDAETSFTISLGGASRKDTGLALFHMNSGSGIACASCHPEGRDDGRVWSFEPIGPRRTQVPAGGILDTAPFHWSGDMPDFSVLVHEVFSERMGGGLPSEPQMRAFGRWLDTMPMPVPSLPADAVAAERGRVLFESAQVGCATCHSGAKLTNNESYDVGTGGVFQVPSLVGLAARPPYLHTGCAATLRDRFDPACGGGDQHGLTQALTPAEIDDLVAYLETL